MTVKQLIKQLQKMPQGAAVGVAHHDNCEYEVAGWVNSICIHNKTDIDQSRTTDAYDLEAFDTHPDTWITLHC